MRLFDALCTHFNRKAFAPVLPVKPEHILTGPGCGPLLDQLFEHLAAPGEACLAAAPYYNGFDADLMTRAEVKCIPVFASVGDGTERANFTGAGALRGFDEALAEHNAAGSTVRAILVCNPHNPVGKCYNREALLEYGRFAQTHDLHLVFDEIYAMSTFPTSDDGAPQPFISALNIDWAIEAGCDPRRIHILTSASKDFGLNGFRVGTFISQYNAELMAAMKVTTKLYMVSSPADALFSSLLTDQDFYPHFVQMNQARLSRAYERVKTWCVRHAIPYKPSNAGHFLLVDLARFLPREMGGCELVDETQRETALWSLVLKERLCITPGSNYHHPQVGWFRITFSLQDQVLSKGLQRLEKALGVPVCADADIPDPDTKHADPIATATAIEEGDKTRPDEPREPDHSALVTALCGPSPPATSASAPVPASASAAQATTSCALPLASQAAARVVDEFELLRELSLDSERGRALGCMC